MKNMRNLIAAMLVLLPFNIWAQDDVYFVPKKKVATSEQRTASSGRYSQPVEIVYTDGTSDSFTVTGSSRDIDEYNRRGPSQGTLVQQPDGSFAYQPGDTLGLMNDSIAALTRSLSDGA